MVWQNRRMMRETLLKRALKLALMAAVAVTTAGCTPRNLKADLQLVDVVSGWSDVNEGVGETKIVPGIRFRLKNVSTEAIAAVDMNAVFRNVDPADERVYGEHYARVVARETPLGPGEMTEPILLRSRFGLTGSETLPQLLQNSQFVDRQVTLLAQHGRGGWVTLGVYQVDRAALN
jgi:hypothetical protein